MTPKIPDSSVSKQCACNAGDPGLISALGRSPGEGNDNQYSCLENPMDPGAWQATVHGVARLRHDLATKPPRSLLTLPLYLWTSKKVLFHPQPSTSIPFSTNTSPTQWLSVPGAPPPTQVLTVRRRLSKSGGNTQHKPVECDLPLSPARV